MKKLGLKKITPMCLPLARGEFKRGVVLIISTILLLLVGVGMTGCATIGGGLMKASSEGETIVVKDLLAKGADVNERGLCGGWDAGGDFGVTPLFCAAHGGHMEVAKMLIGRGADVNIKARGIGSFGKTPLTAAVYARHAGIAKLLIEKGADVDYAMKIVVKLERHDEGGVMFLERLVEKQKTPKQPEPLAAKPNTEVSPAIQSDIDEPPAIKTKRNKNAYAIVIGIESYRQKLPKADYAVADAKIISEYLTKAMGYPEENVITLINDRALKSDMEKYFDRWLNNNVEENGRVFIYYSGHGAPNTKTGDAYLVPYDGDPSFIAETGYPIARLYESLGKLKAKEIIVVLDSCFSGAGGRSVLAKGAKPLVMTINMPTIQKNISVMTASSGDQISSAYEKQGHGLFTYFLLKGIKNEDVVKPDGSIKMEDLFGYIKPQVERIARKQFNNEQTPQLIGAKKD